MTKPRTLLAMLTGALILSAAACGEDSPTPPAPTPPVGPSPTTPTTPPSPPSPAGPITTHAGNCELEMLLGPGGSCDVPGGERFEVLDDGSGRYGFITAGTGITFNRFSAQRVSGTDNWRIESLP